MASEKPVIDWRCLRFDELDLQSLYEIMAFRQEVYNVEQDCAYQDADGKDQQALHVVGMNKNGDLSAYARIIPPNDLEVVAIGRVMTRYHLRGTGLGQELMHSTLGFCEHFYPGKRLYLQAQTYLVKFYESFGFETSGPEFLEDGLPHIDMYR